MSIERQQFSSALTDPRFQLFVTRTQSRFGLFADSDVLINGNETAAIDLLNKSIYLDHDFVIAHFLLGTLSMKSGDVETGKKSFIHAKKSLSKLNPDDTLPESDGITVGRFREILDGFSR